MNSATQSLAASDPFRRSLATASVMVLASCLIAFAGPASPPGPGAPASELAPRGEVGPLLELAVKGQTEYRIVIPEAAPAPTANAAIELVRWLDEVTGARFAIVTDDRRPQPREISVGRTNRLHKRHVDFTNTDLQQFGYAIAVEGERLLLVGGNRGPDSAVFALLEEDLGCRWYTPAITHIPRRPTLRLRPTLRTYVPQLQHRTAFSYRNPRWVYHNRADRFATPLPDAWGGSFSHAPGYSVHTFHKLLPAKQYFEDHPEYYAMIRGRRSPRSLCMTHPQVPDLVADNVIAALDQTPEVDTISVSQNDGPGYCTCPNCQDLIDQEGSPTGPLIHFINQVAEKVEKAHPDVLVSTLAYLYTAMPPRTLKARENVAVWFCTDAHAWPFPLLDITRSHNAYHALKGWSDHTEHLYVWDYARNFSYFLLPMPNLPLFRPNMNVFSDCGVEGLYVSIGGERSDMKSWVFAKLMWDPTRNVRALQREYIRDVYAAAAEPIAAYNDMLWEMTEDTNYQALAGRKMLQRRNAFKLRTVAMVPWGQDPSEVPDEAFVLKTAAREGRTDIHVLAAWGTRFPHTATFYTDTFLQRAKAHFDRAEALADDDTIRRHVETARLSIMQLELAQLHTRLLQTGSLPDRAYFDRLLTRFERGLAAAPFLKSEVAQHQKFIETVRDAFKPAPTGHLERRRSADGATVTLYHLGSEWRFKGDGANVGVDERWFDPSLSEVDWGYVRTHTPGGLERQGYADFRGFGWYRKTIDVPTELSAAHRYLYFGAVDEDAWVWVDGQLIIDHSAKATGLTPGELWQTPFSREVTDRVKPDASHQLTVRFLDRSGMAGIWKPVYLVASDKKLTTAQITKLLQNGE